MVSQIFCLCNQLYLKHLPAEIRSYGYNRKSKRQNTMRGTNLSVKKT